MFRIKKQLSRSCVPYELWLPSREPVLEIDVRKRSIGTRETVLQKLQNTQPHGLEPSDHRNSRPRDHANSRLIFAEGLIQIAFAVVRARARNATRAGAAHVPVAQSPQLRVVQPITAGRTDDGQIRFGFHVHHPRIAVRAAGSGRVEASTHAAGRADQISGLAVGALCGSGETAQPVAQSGQHKHADHDLKNDAHATSLNLSGLHTSAQTDVRAFSSGAA
jgi:hypothetical protein